MKLTVADRISLPSKAPIHTMAIGSLLCIPEKTHDILNSDAIPIRAIAGDTKILYQPLLFSNVALLPIQTVTVKNIKYAYLLFWTPL